MDGSVLGSSGAKHTIRDSGPWTCLSWGSVLLKLSTEFSTFGEKQQQMTQSCMMPARTLDWCGPSPLSRRFLSSPPWLPLLCNCQLTICSHLHITLVQSSDVVFFSVFIVSSPWKVVSRWCFCVKDFWWIISFNLHSYLSGQLQWLLPFTG